MRPLYLILAFTLMVPSAANSWSQGLDFKGSGQQRVLAALEENTAFDFTELPLDVALRLVSEIHEVPVVLDHKALEQVGLAPDVPVTVHLKGISLRAALQQTLKRFALQILVRDDVLHVTTVETNCGVPEAVEIYSLPKDLAKKSGHVIEMIIRMIQRDAWEPYGGASRIVAIDHVLVVYTTPKIQKRVDVFLAELCSKHSRTDGQRP